jgi:hypothetical protein
MTSPDLARLERIDPRSVWAHEALGFTRWLVANLDALSEAMGLEIEADAEVDVGAFSVDLAGKDLGSGRPVIIENQLAQTDHGHLGQLMTYAAGLDAAIVVWISPRFRDEHRRALDWLNAHTDEGLDFFGVEIELLTIGDSMPAPNFKLVAQPNEWAKGARHAAAGAAATSPSERSLRYRAFFERVLSEFKARRPAATTASRVAAQNWFPFSAGRSGLAFTWAFVTGNRLRTELYIDAETQDAAKAIFDALKARAEEIELGFGEPLSWERLDRKRASRVGLYRDVPVSPDPVDNAELVEWAVDSMVRLNDVLRPLVKQL